jgi:predicted PhzF superfamily epimerase YddE/YHI9
MNDDEIPPLQASRRLHRHPYRGNPLAVVLDGRTSDDAAMQRFAQWTNLSETTFLLPPTDPAARLPRAHLHARRRAAVCRPSDHRQLPCVAAGRRQAQGGGRVVQQCGAGLVPLRRDGERLAFAAPPLKRSAPSPALLARWPARWA